MKVERKAKYEDTILVSFLFIGSTRHALEPLCEGLGITVAATLAHFIAADNRIPGDVRPFDYCFISHDYPTHTSAEILTLTLQPL